MVTVEWKTNFTINRVGLQYSIDGGKSWREAWDEVVDPWSPTSRLWRVPHLKHGTNQALLRIFPEFSTDSTADISDVPFTISASGNDSNEPNDDFSSAKTIAVADSVVIDGLVFKSFAFNDSDEIDTSLTDVDYFKVNLTAGKVVTISDPSNY